MYASSLIRENAKEVVQTLNSHNIQTIMLTGDNSAVANKVVKEVGIQKVIANVMPNKKQKLYKA